MKQKRGHSDCTPLDLEQLRLDLQSDDEATRARAVRALCPCHAGWQPFEQNMRIIADLQKDVSPEVRGVAKHVFEDAAQMECGGYPTNTREVSNEMLRTKRASRFRPDAEEVAQNERTRRGARARKGGHA